MSNVSKYWQFVKINSAGQRKVEEIAIAKTFIERHSNLENVSELEISKQLFEQWHNRNTAHSVAEICLRCFISNEIDRLCKDLANRFGDRGNFKCNELYPYALNDTDLSISYSVKPEKYRSIAEQTLHTFDPTKAQLNTWIKRLVTSQLNRFLQECGIHLATDWSILNSATLDQLQDLLVNYSLTSTDIQRSAQLLEAYHAVYRGDRLKFKRPGSREKCLPPTVEQCDRIVVHLQAQGIKYVAKNVIPDLQIIAAQIRSSRNPITVAIDESNPLPDETSFKPKQEEEENDFLTRYNQQLQSCLLKAMKEVVSHRIEYYKKKKPPQEQAFLEALYLFHCESWSMGAIAPQIGLKKQYQVTRLLGLNAFRADVQQTMLACLQKRISKLAGEYVDLDSLTQLEQKIKTALEELIQEIIDEATAEASTANSSSKSLFAYTLCQQLNDRSNRHDP